MDEKHIKDTFALWGEIFDKDHIPLMDKRYTHKSCPNNVHIAQLKRVSISGNSEVLALFNIDSEHSYFFEHPQDHVPGLMLIEAARQFSIAASHLFYDVPIGPSFIVSRTSVEFHDFVELHQPLFGRGEFTNIVTKKNSVAQVDIGVNFIQNNRTVTTVSGSYSIMKKHVIDRIRSKANKTKIAKTM